jgi:mannose-binding lectin 1
MPNQVALPAGNTFGITAATPENPDSFEVFKFILESASGGQTSSSNQGSAPQQPIVNKNPPVAQSGGNPATDAGLAAQFVDLSGRLQLTNKATNTILQDMKNQAAKSDARQAELLQKLASQEQLAALLDSRLARMEQLLQNILRDVEGKDYSSRFNQLHETLRSSHMSLSENLQGHLLSGKSFPVYPHCMP